MDKWMKDVSQYKRMWLWIVKQAEVWKDVPVLVWQIDFVARSEDSKLNWNRWLKGQTVFPRRTDLGQLIVRARERRKGTWESGRKMVEGHGKRLRAFREVEIREQEEGNCACSLSLSRESPSAAASIATTQKKAETQWRRHSPRVPDLPRSSRPRNQRKTRQSGCWTLQVEDCTSENF